MNYDKAIELDPNNAISFANRGSAYHMLGNYKKAIADYEKAMELGLSPEQSQDIEELLETLR